jgi:general secretion pathway protein E
MVQHSIATGREDAFLDWLLAKAAINQPTSQRITTASQNTGVSYDSTMLELGLLSEDQLADELASFLGLDRIALDAVELLQVDVPGVQTKFLLDAGLLPLSAPPGQLHVATARPLSDTEARAAAYFSNLDLVMKVATLSELQRKIHELRDARDPDASGQEENDPTVGESDAEKLRDIASAAPVIRLLSRIVADAVEQNASDIHFEPVEQKLQVRFRVDGVLRVADLLDLHTHLALVSRVKILARLNIAEQRLPQDGRIRLAVRGKNIDFRVATSPTVNGETVVLRILDKQDVRFDFSALGFSEPDQKKLQRIFQHRDGVVLVTGPTGSGKTTTLYAALNALNQPESKIFTVEDPVEYQLSGINQIPVRANIGLDFATILRSVLRQDPDVIMVGEIRDAETARVAVQASLTGHLVLSTAHTNSAVAAITRLRDLGIENYLLSSSVRAIIAQRLVRKICGDCSGVTSVRPACDACQGSGYRGRTCVYELLEFTPALQRASAAGQNDIQLLAVARSEGFVGLSEHARSLVQSGVTTSSEANRAVAEFGS